MGNKPLAGKEAQLLDSFIGMCKRTGIALTKKDIPLVIRLFNYSKSFSSLEAFEEFLKEQNLRVSSDEERERMMMQTHYTVTNSKNGAQRIAYGEKPAATLSLSARRASLLFQVCTIASILSTTNSCIDAIKMKVARASRPGRMQHTEPSWAFGIPELPGRDALATLKPTILFTS